MRNWLKRNAGAFGTTLVVVVSFCVLGCPPPPAPVVTTPTYVAPQPAQPMTEEWVPVPTQVYYDHGSTRLGDAERAMLAEAHASMSNRTDIVRISIEGHADDGGSEARNNLLAEERAQGVMDYLTGTLGMPRELFEVHSFGNNRPLTSGTTTSDRATNRRVEFRMLVRRQAAY